MIEKIKTYYRQALRTSLLAQDKLSQKWIHLFSVIELQAEDEYPYGLPTEDWQNNTVRSKQSNLESYTFYLCIDKIPVEDSINAFDDPIGNFNIDGQRISFLNSSFIKEPSGEYPLVFPANFYTDKGVSSVLPKRRSGLLVWCQIDRDRKTENHFISPMLSKEMLAIQKLTMDWLGFDIIMKREHLGNIYLSAPNPYFREVDVTLSLSPSGIFYKILKRKNIDEPLIFRIIDKHGDAMALDKTYKITDSVGLLTLPHEPHLFELRIYTEDNELIALHEPATFLRTVEIGMSLKEADFHVSVETGQGNKDFVVEKFSSQSPTIIGSPKNFNPEYFFNDAERERLHIDEKSNKEFIFFPGAKTEFERSQLKESAKTVIREILNNAKDTCYLCDPYFSAMDIVDFAFHIKNSGVQINILNSKQFVSKDKASRIAEVVESYNSKPFSDIVAKTLRGDSILHDRFIITDKSIWFVGSSFNEIGNRATCIAKVPESSGRLIIKEVEKWFHGDEYSQDIIQYAKEENNG